jgi:hypothetical protein
MKISFVNKLNEIVPPVQNTFWRARNVLLTCFLTMILKLINDTQPKTISSSKEDDTATKKNHCSQNKTLFP